MNFAANRKNGEPPRKRLEVNEGKVLEVEALKNAEKRACLLGQIAKIGNSVSIKKWRGPKKGRSHSEVDYLGRISVKR